MDNFTHSLIGAALGQAGLKRKTGLAMPALIIAANIPDIDAGCVVFGVESLAMRRGITHGPIAMLVLPLLLAGALWWFDSWQARRGTRPEGRLPVHFGWLLALSVIGCLSHPLFDWFNNYGVRLLEPFSSQWFYGDTLFIIDPWILAMLGWGIWYSLRRERAGKQRWRWPAEVALVGTGVFASLNLGLSLYAESQARHLLLNSERYREPVGNDVLVVANAVPIAFWKREMLWRDAESYGQGSYDAFDGGLAFPANHSRIEGECWDVRACEVEHSIVPFLHRTPLMLTQLDFIEPGSRDPAVKAFLFWSRMPIIGVIDNEQVLRDQRFMDRRTAAQFSVTLRPPKR